MMPYVDEPISMSSTTSTTGINLKPNHLSNTYAFQPTYNAGRITVVRGATSC